MAEYHVTATLTVGGKKGKPLMWCCPTERHFLDAWDAWDEAAAELRQYRVDNPHDEAEGKMTKVGLELAVKRDGKRHVSVVIALADFPESALPELERLRTGYCSHPKVAQFIRVAS